MFSWFSCIVYSIKINVMHGLFLFKETYSETSIQGTPLRPRQVSPEVFPEWRLGWSLLIINLGNLLQSFFEGN